MTVDSSVTRRRLPLRVMSAVVLVFVAGLGIAGCLVTRQVVADQEHKLLKQRTDEAALYLTSSFNAVQSELSSVAATAAVHRADPAAFVNDTKLLVSLPQGFKTLALIRLQPSVQLVATAGAPIDPLGPQRTTAATTAQAKALPTGSLVATPLFDGVAGKTRKLGFAYLAPQLPGYVVYAETDVQPSVQTSATSGQPFSELIAAVYAVPRVAADQLIASTGGKKLPLRGHTASATSQIGQGQAWLLVTKARHPLVGSVAEFTPWALLGAGLLAALLATAVVESLSRRREYASAVAEERTRELQRSLEDLASAHEQLVRQERLAAIGELASTIGHELRNPLGVISNALYLLRADIAANPSDASSRHLSTAEREVSAATVIVSDLLEFARQRDPVLTEVDVVALVEEALGVLPPPSSITVRRELPGSPLRVIADRDMFRQVLLNLVGNAYQALPDGGTVTVTVSDTATGVSVAIADNGVGMTPEVKDKLFQPFFTTKARGVGLGLAVTKRIVDAHSGQIAVESTPGTGATFVVMLPQIRVPEQNDRGADDRSEVEA